MPRRQTPLEFPKHTANAAQTPDPDDAGEPWPTPLRLGVSLTALYVFCVFLFIYWNYYKVISLDPNEIGDFLAGTFAPMAFLWLVIAVFLQKIALQAQISELKESVKQFQRQTDQLTIANEQRVFDAEKTNTYNKIKIISASCMKLANIFNIESEEMDTANNTSNHEAIVNEFSQILHTITSDDKYDEISKSFNESLEFIDHHCKIIKNSTKHIIDWNLYKQDTYIDALIANANLKNLYSSVNAIISQIQNPYEKKQDNDL